MNATRNGKIARLPRTVREELNQRLADGEMGLELVQWLNALPEVQTILAAHFSGRPITEQNLSVWKQGGYADWVQREEAREWVGGMLEDSADADAGSDPVRLADRIAVPVLMQLARLLQKATTSDNAAEQRKTALGVAHQLTQLRRADYQAERLQLEKERMEMKREEVRKQQRKEESLAAAGAQIRADFHLDEYGRPTRQGLAPDIAHCFAVNARLRREAGLPVHFGGTAADQPNVTPAAPPVGISHPTQSR